MVASGWCRRNRRRLLPERPAGRQQLAPFSLQPANQIVPPLETIVAALTIDSGR